MRKSVRRWISLCICAACLLSTVQIQAAWDGYAEKDDSEGTVLVDMADVSKVITAGAISVKSGVLPGRSAHWNNHTKTTSLNFSKVARDWSGFSAISFDIYSEKATNAEIAFYVGCDYVPNPGKTISYQVYKIRLNWTGLKTFNVGYEEFTTGNYGDWAKVNNVYFYANQYSCTPDPESDIYISSIRGVGTAEEEGSTVASLKVTQQERKDLFNTLGGTVLGMNFGGNIIADGEIVPLEREEQITTSEGLSFAPTGFFVKAIGAAAEVSDGAVTLTHNGHTLTAATDTKAYTLDGKTQEFSATPFAEDGDVFLPLGEAAAALGERVTYDGTMTAIGENTSVFSDAEMVEDAKILLCVKEMSADAITKEDWRELKDKWRKYLVGDENNNLEDERVSSKIKKIDQLCESTWGNMNKNSDTFALFGAKDVEVTKDMTNQYNYFLRLATAYGTYGSKYYKDPALRRDILYGLDWMYENLYGEDELNGTGWRSTADFNWWDWYVGAAQPLCDILLIMEDDLTPAKIKNYLSVYDYLKATMRTQRIPSNAAGRIYTGTASAALQEDYERMMGMVDDYNLLLIPVEYGNGVHEDDLYMTHLYFAYSTLYGCSSLLDRLTVVEGILSGTEFEFNTPYKYASCNWLYETFEPLIFNGNMTSAQMGRAKAGYNESDQTDYAVAAMLDFIGAFGKDDDLRLKQMIKRDVLENNIESVYNWLNVDQTVKLSEILEDDNIQAVPYYKNKIYYTGDSIVHHRGEDYGFALCMSSSRIAAWESVNSTNMTGWYQGDGMVYMYLENDKSGYDIAYWKNVNPYHLPGTTVDTQERVVASIENSAQTLTHQDFVGGVGDNEFAVAAMQLESHHMEEEIGEVTTAEYGGAAPLHNSTLMAKKAWFMLDNELVALGTDVNANDGFEVQTIVENRRLNKKITPEHTAEAAPDTPEYTVVSISSSGDDGNVAENTMDGDYDTRWSCEGAASITFGLEDLLPIGYVGIAQYNSDGTAGKNAIFELEVSDDGVNWTTVWEGQSSGAATQAMEAYDMKGVTAKYVRYMGHGRVTSQWNSITEFKIYPPTADGSMPVDGPVDTAGDNIFGGELITVDGQAMEVANTWTQSFTDPKWMHIENVAGYYFPNGGSLTLDKVLNGTTPYLEAWFSHGVSPKGGTYAYAMLPAMTVEETAAYSADPDFEILSNTASLQAIKEKKLNTVGAVFWEPGSVSGITASVPMIVMDRTTDGVREICISDPTQKLPEGTVTVSGTYSVVECDDRLTVTSANGSTTITANFNESKGRSLVVKLK